MKKTILIFLSALPLLAQSSDGDQIVSVPKKYVSTEGLAHQSASGASEWIGIGREIGVATREGLSAVVDVSEKFGTTNVGRFVMFMVAWKVVGQQLVGIILGVPLWISGVALWWWSMRRFFWGSRVLVKEDKVNKIKEYGERPAYKFQGGDGRTACGLAHVTFLAVWCIMWMVVIF